MYNEATIRDYLAENLSILEEGLVAVATEYPLPNPDGSDGSIDILAKDVFGQHVIIELKRSNQAARNAIHELNKYPALLKQKLRLTSSNIRCILVSTEWRELIRPFSEFAPIFNYRVDGYIIEVTDEGKPVSAKQVRPLSQVEDNEPIEFSSQHFIFFFLSIDRLAEALLQLERAARRHKLENNCIVQMQFYRPEVIPYPFALYFAFAKIDDGFLLEDYADDVYGSLEEIVLNRVVKELSEYYDDIEIGYPEKLDSMLDTWSISRVLRGGRFVPSEFLSDEEIIRELTGVSSGKHAHLYTRTTSPKYAQIWKDTRKQAKRILYLNKTWYAGFDWFMDKIQRQMPNATVSVFIRDFNFVLQSLYGFAKYGEVSNLPLLEIVAQDKEQDLAIALVGSLTWDEKTFPLSVTDSLPQQIQANRILLWLTEKTKEYNQEVLAKHGLSYGLVEATLKDGNIIRRKLKITNKNVEIGEILYEPEGSLEKFLTKNKTYLMNVLDFYSSFFIDSRDFFL